MFFLDTGRCSWTFYNIVFGSDVSLVGVDPRKSCLPQSVLDQVLSFFLQGICGFLCFFCFFKGLGVGLAWLCALHCHSHVLVSIYWYLFRNTISLLQSLLDPISSPSSSSGSSHDSVVVNGITVPLLKSALGEPGRSIEINNDACLRYLLVSCGLHFDLCKSSLLMTYYCDLFFSQKKGWNIYWSHLLSGSNAKRAYHGWGSILSRVFICLAFHSGTKELGDAWSGTSGQRSGKRRLGQFHRTFHPWRSSLVAS